jgi:pimeloyl-ACP methyl ester carboxylesterase
MVIDMKAVINTLRSKYGNGVRIFALGHSWGGTLTAKYMITEDFQYLLNGWIQSNGAHDIPKLNRDAVRKFIDEAQRQISLGNHVSDWQGILDWASAIDTNNITDEQSLEINSKARDVEEWLREDGFIQSPEPGGIKYTYIRGTSNPVVSITTGLQTNGKLVKSGIEELAMTNELYKVKIPTLALWGEYDFVVPPTLGVDCYNKVSSTHKKLVILQYSGHSPMANEWREYVDAITGFIDSVK